jgi:hypothetical protein
MKPSVRAKTALSPSGRQRRTFSTRGSLCGMGLLDEAIKQHLELKRRRGADPSEIERLEREALGPIRQLQQEASAKRAVPSEEDDAAYEEHEDGEEPYEEYEFGPDDEQELGEVPPGGDEVADELAEPPGAEPAESEDHLGVETVEYDVEAERAREEDERDSEEGDMLEETPEFFQDAPDHDRLWFEQRPPKDFDFEG